MTKPRLTITMTDDMLMNLKQIQSRLINKTKKNWSFSATISLVASIGLGSKDFEDLIDIVIENKRRMKKK